MDCEKTKELLPWLLNGTLEGPEQESVERHLERCEPCRRELQDSREAAAIFSQHIPADALVEHVFGRDTAGLSAQRINHHLAECPACRAERALIEESRGLLDNAGGARVAPEAPLVRFPATASSWLGLAAAVVLAVTAAGWAWTWLQLHSQRAVVVGLEQQLRDTGEPVDGGLSARVAELEGAVTDIGEHNRELTEQLGSARDLVNQLSRRLEAIRMPQLNVPVIDLFPGSLILRGDEEVTTVSRQAGVAMLVLSTRIREADPDLGIRLVDAGGIEQWRRSGLQLSAHRDFSLHLPTSLLPPGRYQLLIVAEQADGEDHVLESYTFDLG